MNDDLKDILDDCEEQMGKAIESLKRDLSRIRTGRANLAVLDGIRVEYYGSMTPLNQVAALTVADARLITVKPWDKALLTAIEKSIVASDIGLTPNNDGEIIRLPVPPLTGERRKDLAKQVGKIAEEAKVKIRNSRRDANELLKDIEGMSEDDVKRAKDLVQTKTDGFVKKVDDLTAAKEKEIMEV
ncbi:MAG: ribosome recycling factor [Myxococcales bacterium]|nr:ribosome recycling factor [Myxococcales bacterium]